MIKLFKKDVKILFYDSIDLPHRNYMKFNKEMMRANEVGGNPSDIPKRLKKALAFNNAGEAAKVATELSNAEIAYNYVLAEIDPQGLALAAITKSIGGVMVDDFSTSGLQDTLSQLQDLGITKREVDENTDTVKKNWKMSLKSIFPKISAAKIYNGIKRYLTA